MTQNALFPRQAVDIPIPDDGSADPLERYYTPAWMTRALLLELDVAGLTVLDPCAGQLDMVQELEAAGANVETWDVDLQAPVDRHVDYVGEPIELGRAWDAVITNPPFSLAAEFLQLSLARAPIVALLLRSTWPEPCDVRAEILTRWPPRRTIALPRGPFRRPHQDGSGGDSAPAWWFLWGNVEPGLVAYSRAQLKGGDEK